MAQVLDALKRPLRDLRISVTDRCNFRCTYCMPKEVFGDDYPFLPKGELLTFEEITRLARLFTTLGVSKIRITGGEPLLRKNIHILIEKLKQIEAINDIGMTTNAVLLSKYAEKLYDAGLRRLNISLDALDETIFGKMNGRGVKPQVVLEQIERAKQLGFNIKVNMVVQKGVNDTEIIPMAMYFKERGITLRFIEFMDVGNDNKWSFKRVVSKREILAQLEKHFRLEPLEENYFGEVAQRYRYEDHEAEVGFITSVSESFCATCTRARLSSDGKLYTCLFASDGYDLRSLIRSHKTDEEILDHITSIWTKRKDRYSDERTEATAKGRRKINMSYIGG